MSPTQACKSWELWGGGGETATATNTHRRERYNAGHDCFHRCQNFQSGHGGHKSQSLLFRVYGFFNKQKGRWAGCSESWAFFFWDLYGRTSNGLEIMGKIGGRSFRVSWHTLWIIKRRERMDKKRMEFLMPIISMEDIL